MQAVVWRMLHLSSDMVMGFNPRCYIYTETATFSWILCSTLGQGLQTSTFPGEVIFSIGLAILGLILFALLIGNMQVHTAIFNCFAMPT